MAKAVLLLLLPLLLVLLPPPFGCVAQLAKEFCVADLASTDTPAGYPCKLQAAVTADDFYYRGLGTTGPIIQPFKISLSSAFVTNFPGVNGFGISAARVDLAVGGVVPLHWHPAATELIFVLEGTLSCGFISATSNRVYTNTLYKGDLMVLPQGQQHFQYNIGNTTAAALSTYSSHNPVVQTLDFALFANNLPTEVVSKVTLLDDLQVKKLKAIFGGTG
ncbi:germin-like protein 8-14 [Hordeum vulgare subsp. vulgare]|uniref:Germin-like protein n=1 Tax=Hordeum vulgare subsp. vulgare TaxID=112509 RepID=A0A8I6XSW3_HORVV|nr:germin-like protein 8-14 [Hordeum vulgare subsp. vulgare]